MRIYFDACCYSRPYDNLAHLALESVQREITAIMDAVQICATSGFPIIGSSAVIAEMSYIKDDGKREQVRSFYDGAISEELAETADIVARAQELNLRGIKGLDSYHAAFAEAAGADYLLTTDSRFERTAGRLKLKTNVINPINFFGEYALWLLLST